MDFGSYVIDQCLIMVPVLYALGAIFKRVPKIPDWIIPFALLAIGVVFCVGISLRPESGMDIVGAIIQGVLVTGAAVLVDQGIKQAINRT